MARWPNVYAAIAALCGTLSMVAPGFAAGQNCQGFARIGDRFPDAAKAMSAEERALFYKVRLILEEVQRPDLNDWLAIMPGASRNSVHGVKTNPAGGVLVNLKPDIKPRMQPIGNDRYYAHVAGAIHHHMASTQHREPERFDGYVPWPYHVCFVFNGMAPFADEDIPMRWPTWFVPYYSDGKTPRSDFARDGGVYVDAARPMSSFERVLFDDIRKVLKSAPNWRVCRNDGLPADPSRLLLAVKVSTRGGILLNFKDDMPRPDVDGDDSSFYHCFEQSIYTIAEKRFDIRRVTYDDHERLPEIRLYFAYEGRVWRPPS